MVLSTPRGRLEIKRIKSDALSGCGSFWVSTSFFLYWGIYDEGRASDKDGSTV